MGIRFQCPSGHKLHVKTHLAGKRGICPHCGARFTIPEPTESEPVRSGDSHKLQSRVGNENHSSADVGTPSIVIALADKDGGTATAPAVVDLAAFEEPATPASPVVPIVAETKTPVAVPARYMALRERSRRNQVTLAAALLIAVIVLALILIWVVGRNSVPASAAQASRHNESVVATEYKSPDLLNGAGERL